jgi:ApaG protein
VISRLDEERSAPERQQWFYLYTVRITNGGSETVQLLSRHWIITDGEGEVEEVRGPGVVGEQPILLPGESFDYTSGCPLPTPFGSMRGSYQMVTEGGESFDAEIATFELSQPYLVN